MHDLVFDVSAPFDAQHFVFSGRDDGLYILLKLVPKPGYHLVKVVDGLTVLWEKGKEPLEFLVLHKLGNLPAFLFLKLSDSGRYFEFRNLTWSEINEVEYKEKLTLDLDRHNLEGVDFDLSHINPKDVTVIKLLDGSLVNHSFFPEVKKAFVTVRDGDNLLWKAAKDGDKCLLVSFHEAEGSPKFLRLALLESNTFAQKFFENVSGKWISMTIHAYFEKRAPKDPQIAVLDLSVNHNLHVGQFVGSVHGVPYDVFFSSILGKVVKVVDGNDVLWEGKGGEKCVLASLSHDLTHVHLLVLLKSGQADLYFEKKNGEWNAVFDGFPNKFKVTTY
ncbi:82-kilodalton protein [Theileria equi strain WA]|uniref:82-kilodalton protein n=1 Tax=Theileria equi strain WA TaxID=1537102 RepID=L0AVQ0_THEEQ|nr:82-kilodalton protein [Theileria equi strain WA]AFZ79625.1 82-kilodalton protein [Theileria equi strain WA]|eukprot:XP_004829291.1 82-kilodalton protein [Theileria equi strain WA]